MFINATRLATNTWQLYCNSCAKPTDVVDSEELAYLMMLNEGAICMGCDPGVADEIPRQLWMEETPYLLIFESESIVVCDWPGSPGGLREKVLFLRNELEKILDENRYLKEDFCLSSFSNLKGGRNGE